MSQKLKQRDKVLKQKERRIESRRTRVPENTRGEELTKNYNQKIPLFI